MTTNRYPDHAHGVGAACWCQSQQLPAHVLSREIDGTIHARAWCDRLRSVPTPLISAPGNPFPAG